MMNDNHPLMVFAKECVLGAYSEAELADAARRAINYALEANDEPEYYGLTKDHLWMSISKEHYDRLKPEFRMACYTTPPQRKPLTDEEIFEIIKRIDPDTVRLPKALRQLARAIEAAHGIKEKNV